MIIKRFSIQSGKPKHSVGLLGELGRKSKKYIPIGADMDYIDSLTLESALKNRKEVLD